MSAVSPKGKSCDINTTNANVDVTPGRSGNLVPSFSLRSSPPALLQLQLWPRRGAAGACLERTDFSVWVQRQPGFIRKKMEKSRKLPTSRVSQVFLRGRRVLTSFMLGK